MTPYFSKSLDGVYFLFSFVSLSVCPMVCCFVVVSPGGDRVCMGSDEAIKGRAAEKQALIQAKKNRQKSAEHQYIMDKKAAKFSSSARRRVEKYEKNDGVVFDHA